MLFLPILAFAETYTGTTGGCSWSLNTSTGILTISGNGAIGDYTSGKQLPWYNYTSSIKTVTIQSGVTRIGSWSMVDMPNILSVTIPNTVTSIGDHAFSYSPIKSISIPSSVGTIEEYAFANTELTSITIPSSVTTIKNGAFVGCDELTSISLPSNLATLSDAMLSGCKKLTSINLPNKLTTIGDNALAWCSGLQYLSIPSSVTTIGEYAFYECSGLISISLPRDLTYLNKGIFSECSNLKAINIPSTVTSIYEYAFENCSSLANITIPSKVSNLKQYAFDGCSSLKIVTCLKEDPNYFTLLPDVFEDIDSKCTLHVPCGTSDTYISNGWTEEVFGGGIYELGYAVYTENDNTLTFYYDSGAQLREGEVYPTVKRSSGSDKWGAHKADIKRVVFYPTFSQAKPTSTSNWFNGCYNIEEIIDMQYLNTENVTTMYAMFNGTAKNTGALYALNLSSFNTSKVTDMRYMFNSCSGIHRIAVSDSWTTAKVNKSDNMFNGCKALVGGDGTKYSASYIDKTKAYAGAGGYLTMLGNEPEGYAVYTAKDSTLTFYCDEKAMIREGDVYTNLVRKKKSDQWGEHNADIKKVVFDDTFGQYEVTTTAHWFNGCVNLEEVLGTYNVSGYNITSAYAMFNGCKKLREVNIGFFTGNNLTSASYMFNSCSELLIIWGSEGFSLTANKSDNMFTGCTKLVGYSTDGSTIPYDPAKTNADMCNYYDGYITSPMVSKTYAAYSDGVLTFYCDGQFVTRQGCDLYTNLIRKKKTDQWGVHNEEIKKVVFDASVRYPMFYGEITSTAHWFNGCVNLETIEGLEYLDTENVTSMYAMFNGCKKLKILDLTNLNTANVKNMSYMFNSCSNLRLIYADTETFDTSSVTKSDMMFNGCTKLVGYFEMAECAYNPNNVDVYAADYAPIGYFTSCVLERTYAKYEDGVLSFHYDTGFAGSDADIYYNLDRKKKTDQWGVHNEEITKVVIEDNFRDSWDYSNTAHWFNGCVNLETIEGLENLNTESVTSMYAMFNGCRSLRILDLTDLHTENVKNMSYMFNGCSNLRLIYADTENFDTRSVTKSEKMFYGCTKLVGYFEMAECAYNPNNVDVYAADYAPGGYFTSCIMERTYAKYEDGVLSFHYDTGFAGSDADIYFNLERTKKTDLWGVHNEEITKVVFEDNFDEAWDYSIESTAHWFNGCVNLTEIEGMENLVASPSSTYAMFNGCSKLTSVDLTGLYTGYTTNMSYMFNSCAKLTTITVSQDWITERVTKSTNMFNGCRVLKGDGGFKYNASYTDKTKAYGGGDGKGYLTLVEREDMAKNRDFTEPEATGIENVATEKALDGKVYSLSGRLIGTDIDIQTLPKGIYIVGGKKVSVR